jgi:hypothetical protein
MQSLPLTDEELWRAIVENTNAMSAVVDQQLKLPTGITASDLNRKADLLRSHSETINKFEREYQDCTTELRRRYP